MSDTFNPHPSLSLLFFTTVASCLRVVPSQCNSFGNFPPQHYPLFVFRCVPLFAFVILAIHLHFLHFILPLDSRCGMVFCFPLGGSWVATVVGVSAPTFASPICQSSTDDGESDPVGHPFLAALAGFSTWFAFYRQTGRGNKQEHNNHHSKHYSPMATITSSRMPVQAGAICHIHCRKELVFWEDLYDCCSGDLNCCRRRRRRLWRHRWKTSSNLFPSSPVNNLLVGHINSAMGCKFLLEASTLLHHYLPPLLSFWKIWF